MKYFCAKSDGLSLCGNHYDCGSEIPEACTNKNLIRWGWIRVEGTRGPYIVASKSKNQKAKILRARKAGKVKKNYMKSNFSG